MHVGESAEKKDVLERLLELGMVLVALDARAEGVDVPDHLGRDPQLRLNLSFRFGLPMSVDPWGISATLTFGGVPYSCRFPWGAIYLLVSHVNGEPYLFPDEVPPELLAQVGVEGAWSLPNDKRRPAPAPRPKLSLVVPPPEADDETDVEAEADGQAAHGCEDDKSRPAATESHASPPAVLGRVPADPEGKGPHVATATKRSARATARRATEQKSAPQQQNVDADGTDENKADDPADAEAPTSAGSRPVDKNAAHPATEGAAPSQEGPSPGRRRGHLRLVK